MALYIVPLRHENLCGRIKNRLGHGIGMDMHEWPYLVRGNTTKLQPNMTTSDEPDIYIRGEFGIRLEDDMYVTEKRRRIVHAAESVTGRSVRESIRIRADDLRAISPRSQSLIMELTVQNRPDSRGSRRFLPHPMQFLSARL